MNYPNYPRPVQTGTDGALPTAWTGVDVPDGDAVPFVSVPVGSEFIYRDTTNGRVRKYVKRKNDGADNDWGVQGSMHCLTQTITRAQFTDGGGAAGTKVLGETIPAGAFVLRTIIANLTGFTGDTSAVITVGDGTDVDRYNAGTPSVFTTAVAVDGGAPSGVQVHVLAATVTVTVTSAADFTAVVAGAMTVKIFYLL